MYFIVGTVALKLSHLHYNLRMVWLDASSLSLLRMMDDFDDDLTPSHEFAFQSLAEHDDIKFSCDFFVDMMYKSLLKISSLDGCDVSSNNQRKNLIVLYFRFVS